MLLFFAVAVVLTAVMFFALFALFVPAHIAGAGAANSDGRSGGAFAGRRATGAEGGRRART
jgi:hypothetical protein